ncbi:MAG: NAD(P)H-dependent oxidoreductase subunit E [Kiritimatiellia bacterium]|jgi:NADH:ubiquinone oxidoreductase subunit E|nr:NAD(P)H-dependent oxidoreductase subunit E [Kiritimatiellia bacterium]
MSDVSSEPAAPCGCACTFDESDQDRVAKLHEVIADYRDKPGGLIPALQTAQSLFGYLPEPALRLIADGFGKTVSEVAGVVTFYSFFTLHPRGKHLVRVCLGTACYVRGGKEVLDAFRKKLGIDVGETTADRQFSLEVGRCFGACGMAPVVMVNDTVYQRVKPARVGELIGQITSASAAGGEKEHA